MTPTYEPPKMPKTEPAKSSSDKFTKNQLIREIHNMWKFNYTLASDKVFTTLIQLVRNAPDELFKKEGDNK